MSDTDQLISFFAYSFFIYPVINFLVSPKRPYAKWKGAIYAGIFLAAISGMHIMYENREKGPNYYEVLEVSRANLGANLSELKSQHRRLSKKLHPDKSKSPEDHERFRKVSQAYEVLTKPESRRIYNLYGDEGIQKSVHAIIDHKSLVLTMLVYYVSSAIFAFLMTMSEPSGDAMITSIFGLACKISYSSYFFTFLTRLFPGVCLLEMVLILEEVSVPVWFLPYNTSHEIVSMVRRLFPAFMNGTRCILGDRKAIIIGVNR